MYTEETRPLKTGEESQSFQPQPVDPWPEGQSQKKGVKNTCPDLPNHLNAKMAPQPLKESGEYKNLRTSGNEAFCRGEEWEVRKGAWGRRMCRIQGKG